MKSCDMKGYLSDLILWILNKKNMNGAEITREIEKRKGHKPSPGTIYPALKELKENGWIVANEHKVYFLTPKGEKELKSICHIFCRIFYDIEDMFKFRNGSE